MEPTKALPIADRLDGLALEVRRLRWLAAVLTVATLGLGANAALSRPRPGRTLVAGGVELRDAEGRLRGSFGLDYNGLPGMKLYDQRGWEQVMLTIPSDDTSGLYFLDRGRPRVTLETSIEGTAAFRLMDKEAKDRAIMTLAPDGSPRMAVAERPGDLSTEATAAGDMVSPVDLVEPQPSRSLAEPSPPPPPTAPPTARVQTGITHRQPTPRHIGS
jgi:hypothetical protein